MSIAPTKSFNPCGVCGDVSGACRQGVEDPNYFQCMKFADAKFGQVENGYKCLGLSKNPLWAQFRLDNSREWTAEKAAEWQAQNELRKLNNEKAKRIADENRLGAVERDKQYTEILSKLSLNAQDRADLVHRGFSGSQIELSGIKSVERYQALQEQYSEFLPGVATGGKSLIVSQAGQLIPIRNVDGLIVACQIRVRALPVGEKNRYKWLSTAKISASVKTGFGNAELPISIHRPIGKPSGIALVEGTGAKPFLTSQRLNVLVLGASGGLFASSESVFKMALDRLSNELEGTKELMIYPDAGDVCNHLVMQRWQSVIEMLHQWEWSVKFGWWDQFSKDADDIDELTDLSQIKYISTSEFFALAKDTESPKPSQTEPAWKQKAKAQWRINRSFSNSIKTASQWCEWDKPEQNTIFFGKAGLGRGKTTRLKNWVKEWRQTENTGFICLGYRNTLLLQLCEQLGFYHLHDSESRLMKADPSGGIALCVDSLWRFNPEDFEGKIIILDELKSVIKHLLHSPTVRNRDKILGLFAEAIKRSKQVICLDGLMADWCVDYLHTICPEKQIIKVENTYQGKKPLINFLLGTTGIDEKIKVNDRSPWLKLLLEDSAVPATCADSQVFIESLDNIFTAQGLNVLRIDSKTVSEGYVKEFLKDCNAYIRKHKPDVLLYTPSAESGVDVSIPNYFTHHFGFFFGVLDVDGILQMLGRIRDDITKYVWCKSFVSDSEKQHSKSPFSDAIEKSVNELMLTDISTSINDPEAWKEKVLNHLATIVSNSNDINFRISCLIQSVQNFEKSNLRECLKEALLESGYMVRDCILENSDRHKEKLKAETEAVKRRNAADIFKAEKVAPELVDELKFDSKWEERCKVMQAKLRERLPGIDESPTWTEEFIYKVKYEDRDFISHAEMFWLFNHPEVAKHQSQKNLHWIARKTKTFIGNIKSRWAKIHALHEMGFEKFLNPSLEWSDNSPELIELLKQAKTHSNALGCHPGSQGNIRYLSTLLKMFGLKLTSRKEGKGKRFYRLDEEVLTDPTRLQVLTSIENKFTQPVEALDWEIALNEAHGVLPENVPQTQSEHGVWLETRTPQIVYRNEVSPVSKNLEEIKPNNEEILEPAIMSSKSEIQELSEALEYADSLEMFQAIVEHEPVDVIKDAIALTPQPRQIKLQPAITDRAYLSKAEELASLFIFADTPEIFADVVEGENREDIEDAIALAPSLPIRTMLWGFYEGIHGAMEYLWGNITDRLADVSKSASMG